MTQRSGCSSVTQEIPIFSTEDNSKQIHRNKMRAFLANLALDAITNQSIVDCVRIAKSKEVCSSLGMTNLSNDMLASRITNDE